MIGGERRKIKPKALYPSRDAAEDPPKRHADGDDDRSQSRTRCKYHDLHKNVVGS